jgi:hypothetical protein
MCGRRITADRPEAITTASAVALVLPYAEYLQLPTSAPSEIDLFATWSEYTLLLLT